MKKTPKTAKEIKKELDALTKMSTLIPEYTAFGGNNREKIEAEIRVLADDMSEDEIYGEWPVDGKTPKESEELYREYGEQNSSALYARRWMDGEEEESMSSGWAPLTKKKKK